jgi:protein-S-isoprenylcysteine O-methyltransferase Ste14
MTIRIQREEMLLRETFGEEFDSYSRQVRYYPEVVLKINCAQP